MCEPSKAARSLTQIEGAVECPSALTHIRNAFNAAVARRERSGRSILWEMGNMTGEKQARDIKVDGKSTNDETQAGEGKYHMRSYTYLYSYGFFDLTATPDSCFVRFDRRPDVDDALRFLVVGGCGSSGKPGSSG